MTTIGFKRITAALAACGCLAATNAHALTISDANVVGSVVDGTPSDLASEATYVNFLLGLGLNSTATASNAALGAGGNQAHTHVFVTNPVVDFPSASVTAVGGVQGAVGDNAVPAGYDYVLAKYGNNDVVFHTAGAALTLPLTGSSLFSTGNGLSHYAAFDPTSTTIPTPDGGNTVLLLGAGIATLGLIRRRMS